MIGVTLLTNFARASNPVWALVPDEWRDSMVAPMPSTG
jgi:hypothetical protein